MIFAVSKEKKIQKVIKGNFLLSELTEKDEVVVYERHKPIKDEKNYEIELVI